MSANRADLLPVLAEHVEQADDLTARVQHGGEGGASATGTLAGRRVLVRVPDGYGACDYFVICGCGWCSLPLVEQPEALVCEACDDLAHGRLMFARWFAPNAARFGYVTERVLDLADGGATRERNRERAS